MPKKDFRQEQGRGCDDEVSNLKPGMDFRDIRYRREVFLKFYDFHLQNNAHPGGVYFAMPWMADRFCYDAEQKLWMAFINGCSQNIVTTAIIMSEFPRYESTTFEDLNDWWNKNHGKFKAGSGWDSDRKYFKIGTTGFPQCFDSYKKQVGSSQVRFFERLYDTDPFQTFRNTWAAIKGTVLSFGRLSTFSYLEYLRIVGLPLDCGSLFLEDRSGSKSHRNGLCKVVGRDDLDDHESINPDFPGYKDETIEWLTEEGATLLREAKKRINSPHVSYFTLESTFCNYKSWHRPNRRYPNVYMDMMHDRIEYAETQWGHRFEYFWEMRKDCLPKHLRMEHNPNDPGLSKEKQNHYRLTGQPIMMSKMFPVFANDFDNKCWQDGQGLEDHFGN